MYHPHHFIYMEICAFFSHLIDLCYLFSIFDILHTLCNYTYTSTLDAHSRAFAYWHRNLHSRTNSICTPTGNLNLHGVQPSLTSIYRHTTVVPRSRTCELRATAVHRLRATACTTHSYLWGTTAAHERSCVQLHVYNFMFTNHTQLPLHATRLDATTLTSRKHKRKG